MWDLLDHWDELVQQAKKFWSAWDTQTIVLISLALQIILMALGLRRRYNGSSLIRTTIWSSYLLASWVATVGIGKISDLSVSDPRNPDTKTSLKALLAPLLLLHLGSPDAITAYSIEDNQLGVREIVAAVAQVGLVIWILMKCWTYTKVSYLTLPMFLVGFIKYGERAWALKSALSGNVKVTTSEVDEETNLPVLFKNLPTKIPGADMVLKGYYRFDHLKPHLESWIFYPLYITRTSSLLDGCDPEDVFKITEIELGFVYEALYTKMPIIFTRIGLLLRTVSFAGMAWTFCGFTVMFRKGFSDKSLAKIVSFTFSILTVAVIFELYSNLKLLLSDRAIVWMIQHLPKLPLEKPLPLLVRHSLTRRRWSGHLPQFNLLGFCLEANARSSITTEVLKCFCMEEEWKRQKFLQYRKPVPKELKVFVLHEIQALEGQRGIRPFTKRGEWAIARHGCAGEELKSTICTEFGRSIAIWHVTTEIVYQLDDVTDTSEKASRKVISKWVSEYLMHLLVNLPEMLTVASGGIIYQHLCDVLKKLFGNSSTRNNRQACELLLSAKLPPEVVEKPEDPIVELGWHILPQAQKLSQDLMSKENKWDIISSVLMEMLCYAACNCNLYTHAVQMRRGGEFITLVWLLLAHRTDRFNFGRCGWN